MSDSDRGSAKAKVLRRGQTDGLNPFTKLDDEVDVEPALHGSEGKQEHDPSCSMAYHTQPLTTWEAFNMSRGSVWCRRDLWVMMANLGGVSLLVTFITVIAVADPSTMRVSKFTSVSKFLNVITAWMLGVFLSSVIHRWYQCVNGFLELLDAIRNMQMQLAALGLPADKSHTVLRQAYASAWLLYQICLLDTRLMQKGNSKVAEVDKMWKCLESKQLSTLAVRDENHQTPLLEPNEVDALKVCRDPAAIMWTWIACRLGRFSQDGWLPAAQTPVYGRIMNIAQDAHSAIREVRAAVTIQSSLTYTHCMASLVHINNILCAVTLGIVTGICIGTTLIRQGLHFHTGKVSGKELVQDHQNIAVTAAYCILGPLIFQSMLLIAMDVAQPFASKTSEIPVEHLLHQLELDMCDGRFMMENLPFEKPYFKERPD